MAAARSEDSTPYFTRFVTPAKRDEDAVIAEALAILERRVVGESLCSPGAVKDYLRLRMARLEREEFAVVFLDAQMRVLKVETMFSGTLSQTSVYPREVVKRALQVNAGAVILAHNHPSGVAEPSRADEFLTQTLKHALGMVDVRVLDHVVVATSGCVSMAERGLI